MCFTDHFKRRNIAVDGVRNHCARLRGDLVPRFHFCCSGSSLSTARAHVPSRLSVWDMYVIVCTNFVLMLSETGKPARA